MGSREWKMGASREDRTQRYATSWDLGYVTIITKNRVQRRIFRDYVSVSSGSSDLNLSNVTN